MKLISKNKQKLIDKELKRNLKVGDIVYVHYSNFYLSGNSNKEVYCKILNIDGDIIKCLHERDIRDINIKDISSRYVRHIGANPFIKDNTRIRVLNYSLDGILLALKLLEPDLKEYSIGEVVVKETNWNPYVYINGEKKYYQRDFIWTIEDKRLLIDSIYNRIDCGKVLIRNRGFDQLHRLADNGETKLYFRDIIDGKQRLDAIRGFFHEEFTDSYGNLYSDLSEEAQYDLKNSQNIGYAELDENSLDSEVLQQFLKVNFTGVPQSSDHINYVKSLYQQL